MARYRIETEGLSLQEKQLTAKFEEILLGVASALYMEGEETITDSKRQTPVKTGTLRSSGHVQLPEISGSVVEVEIGFGGPAGVGTQGETNKFDIGYATHVHENLTARYRVGNAKYLENPIKDRSADASERIARRVSLRVK